MKFNFRNKLALVTASSKGIGYEIAKQLALNGAKVAISSRSKKNLVAARNKILKEKKNVDCRYFLCDLSKLNQIDALQKKVTKSFKSNIDILVNNSGGPKVLTATKTKLKDWSFALNNNLLSSILMSQKVIPGMKKNKWGRIINLTSTTAKEPSPSLVLSNVTRAGVISFGKSLSYEIGMYGITVNSILTGGVLTDRIKSLIGKDKKKISRTLKKIANNIPVKRVANPDEFIQIVLFLCSENSSYINGSAITVDGGVSKSIF